MTDDDVESIFAEMTADMDDVFAPAAEDYGSWEKHELLGEFHRVYAKMVHPTRPDTEEDQDLQGRYYGILLEMRKRGMK